jgi:ribosomal protein L18E
MKKLSMTKLKERVRKKTNPVLKETLQAALKNPQWREVAQMLSSPRSNYATKNLFEIDAETKAGDTVIVVGKILSKGDLTKKLRICALAVSAKAEEKIKAQKSEIISIEEEMKKNPKAEGIKILR